MDITKIYQKLLGHFGDSIILGLTEADKGVKDPFITVRGDKVHRVGLYCKVEAVLACDFLQSITGMDTGETLTCVYHLFSYTHGHTLVLKAAVPRDAAVLPSSVSVWPAANWYEREAYDLFDVTFEGHPGLRRLLLPDDWEGHPGLKDYVQGPEYNGIPTSRENPLDLLDEEG